MSNKLVKRPGSRKSSTYRKATLTRTWNLGLLALGVGAGIALGPIGWLALAGAEAGVLWVVPDLPQFRAKIDKEMDEGDIMKERAYYMDQLWGLEPEPEKSLGQTITSWLTEAPPVDLNERVLNRDAASYHDYHEMVGIIAKLKELEELRGVSIPKRDINRLETVINGYLRVVIAAQSMAKSLSSVNIKSLKKELDAAQEQFESAGKTVKPALLERVRFLKAKLERLPKTQALHALYKTRAEAIVFQMRHIVSQVLTDPGTNVNSFLEDMVERHELMVDPLASLEAEQEVDSLLDPQRILSEARAAQGEK